MATFNLNINGEDKDYRENKEYDVFSFTIEKNHIIMYYGEKEIAKAKRSKMTKGLKDPKDMDKLIEAGLSVLDAGSITPDEIINLINELESHLVDDTVEYDYDNASDYDKFKKLLKQYNNNLPKIIKDYVLDYINNERVLSVQIILALMTGLGLDGSIMDINAPAGSGKTENKKALFRLIPNGKDLGKITPAALYKLTGDDYNKYIIYTNDNGLEQGEAKEVSAVVKGILRELATDKIIKRVICSPGGHSTEEYIVEVDALSLIITELHTVGDTFQMGRQMERVTVRLDINPISVPDYKKIVKIMQKPENKQKVEDFCSMHRNYMTYLIENADTEVIIPDEVLDAIIKYFNPVDVTEYKRLISLYRTYCIYFDYDVTDVSHVRVFSEFLNILNKVGKYEQLLFDHIKKYVTPLGEDDQPSSINDLKTNYDDEEIKGYHKFRLTRKRNQEDDGSYKNIDDNPIYFFTVQDVKNCHIYNKGRPLHEYKDMAGDFLQRLRNAGLIEYINTKGEERLYYIPKEA
jgi:hypothetical protein